MRIRIVDAFTDRPFSGNPAGVLLLEGGSLPAAERLQEIAAEVNLSETAFAHPLPPGGAGRLGAAWFTPVAEVDMCGHATLATAHVLHTAGLATGPVRFTARCGILRATAHPDGFLTLDFPTSPLSEEPVPYGLADALGADPVSVHGTGKHIGDLLVELRDEATVRALAPDFTALAAHSRRASSPPPRPRTPPVATTTSRAASSPASASRRTRSPAAPTPRWPPSGRPASAATTSPGSRRRPARGWSAPRCAASAPC
ncbi:hypothetical protein SBADM41S_06707 [Streptomyces badius]